MNSAEFIDSLQHLYYIKYDRAMEIDRSTFLRDIHSDTAEAALLFYEIGMKYRIPVSISQIEDFLRQGPSFIIQDLYDEFMRTVTERKSRRSRMVWGLVAYSMVPVSIYALFKVDIILAFTSATLGSAILTYYYGIKTSSQK